MSPDTQDTAALVISELLTNAVLHGRDKMTLAIVYTGPALEIVVTDHGKAKAANPPTDPDEHGRGLDIVAAITRDLQVEKTSHGWRTRAHMDLAPAETHAQPMALAPQTLSA